MLRDFKISALFYNLFETIYSRDLLVKGLQILINYILLWECNKSIFVDYYFGMINTE